MLIISAQKPVLKVHFVSVSHSYSQDFSLRRLIMKPLMQFGRELNEESFEQKMTSLWWKMNEIQSKPNSPVYPGPPVICLTEHNVVDVLRNIQQNYYTPSTTSSAMPPKHSVGDQLVAAPRVGRAGLPPYPRSSAPDRRSLKISARTIFDKQTTWEIIFCETISNDCCHDLLSSVSGRVF